MRLARRPLALVALLTLLTAPAAAQGTAPAAASGGGCSSAAHQSLTRELLVSSGAEAQLRQTSEGVIDAQLRASPVLAEHFGDLLRGYVEEQMNWSLIEPELVRIYCELFAEGEVKEMLAFNRTPLGQKILRTMPEITRRSMAVGESRMQANMPELQRRVEERTAKLRADGKIPD